MIKIPYDYFLLTDVSSLSLEQRVQAVSELLEYKNKIIFDDGCECCNEKELRNLLHEKRIL